MHPVLVSYDGGPDRAWYGWVYATDCARQADVERGAFGVTYANFPVEPALAYTEEAYTAQTAARTMADVTPVVDAAGLTTGQAPALPVKQNPHAAHAYDIPEAVPAFFRDRLIAAGYCLGVDNSHCTFIDGEGRERVLLHDSRYQPDARAAWWPARNRGSFYNHNPGGLAEKRPRDHGGVGWLALNPVNWGMRNPVVTSRGRPGEPSRVRVEVGIASAAARQAPLAWRFAGETAWRADRQVSLQGWQWAPATLAIPTPDRPRQVEIAINPRRDSPAHESTFSDNLVSVEVAPDALDLALTGLEIPQPVPAGLPAQARVRAALLAGTPPVDSTVRITLAGRTQERAVLFPAPGATYPVTFSFDGLPPGRYTVTARLNPDGLLPESDYTNNSLTATLEVVAAPVPKAGGTRTRLVE